MTPSSAPQFKRISVLIDTYNHARFIGRAIESVLGQEEVGQYDIEIIVVDDGSVDDSPSVIRRYGSRIRYERKENGGQASAFNFGIRLCSGEIVAFLDGDDWWHPRKLSTVLRAFEGEPSLGAVGHGIVEVDEVGGGTYSFRPDEVLRPDLRSEAGARLLLQNGACLGTSRLTARRDVLLRLLDVPEALVFEADEYLFLLLPACAPVAILPELLTYYRIHGGNLYQGSRAGSSRAAAEARTAKLAKIYACLRDEVPARLAEYGCPPQVTAVLAEHLSVAATTLRLQSEGGGRWENFECERRKAMLRNPGTAGVVDRLVVATRLALALLLPPRQFFRLRSRYSGSTLHRLRNLLSAR